MQSAAVCYCGRLLLSAAAELRQTSWLAQGAYALKSLCEAGQGGLSAPCSGRFTRGSSQDLAEPCSADSDRQADLCDRAALRNGRPKVASAGSTPSADRASWGGARWKGIQVHLRAHSHGASPPRQRADTSSPLLFCCKEATGSPREPPGRGAPRSAGSSLQQYNTVRCGLRLEPGLQRGRWRWQTAAAWRCAPSHAGS